MNVNAALDNEFDWSSLASSSVFRWDAVNEALDNELILNMIFDNLVLSCHLKTCRLVCTKWNKLIVKQIDKNNWKNRGTLRLESDGKLEDFINTFGSFKNMLTFSCFSFEGELNHLVLKKFFKTFTNKIKSLYLEFFIKDLEQMEYILESQATSLTELTICSKVENYEKFPIQKNIFKSKSTLCLSNLIYLCLGEYVIPCDYDGYVDQTKEQKQYIVHIQLMNWLLSKIPTENNSPNSVPLRIYLRDCHTLTRSMKSLKLFGHIKHLKMIEISSFKFGELKVLVKVGVKLEILLLDPYITYFQGHDDEDGQMFTNEIHQFLQSQINSLELLDYEARVFKFPSVMINLKVLHLSYDPDSYGELIQIPPIIYHEYFPNIQVLLLQSDDSDSEELQPQTSSEFELQFLCPQEPCLSLKRLSIHYNNLKARTMTRISCIFPQIQSLTLGSYHNYMLEDIEQSELYSEIWNSSFANTLEELHLELDKKNFDEEWSENENPSGLYKLNTLLSGVKQQEIEPLYKWLAFQNYEFDESKYNSILKLKNLKNLRIICSLPQIYPFTNFSAFCIFGNMKKLQVLHLDEKLQKFSPKALEYLRNKKKLCPLMTFSPISSMSNHEMVFPTDANYYNYLQNTSNILDEEDEIENNENVFDKYNNSEDVEVEDIDSGSDYVNNSEDDDTYANDVEKNKSEEEYCFGEVSDEDHPNSEHEDIKSECSTPEWYVESNDSENELVGSELGEFTKLEDGECSNQNEINNEEHEEVNSNSNETRESEDNGIRWRTNKCLTGTLTSNSNDTFEKRDFSFRDASDLTMVLWITFSEHPEKPLTPVKFKVFKDELRERVLGYVGHVMIQIESCRLVSDKGEIRCRNEGTVLWVKNTVGSMLKSEFRAHRVADPPSPIPIPGIKRMWCYVKTGNPPSTESGESNAFLRGLNLQNHRLFTTKWIVFLSVPSGPGCYYVQLGISQDSLKELIKLKFSPYYGIGRLSLRKHSEHFDNNGNGV